MRLHGCDAKCVVILMPETADSFGHVRSIRLVGSEFLGIAQDAHFPPQVAHYHEDSRFTSVMGHLNRSKGTNGAPS